MKQLILIAVLACMVTPAWSAGENVTYGVSGFGNKSCGYWLESRRKKGWHEAIVKAWVNGLLTGVNFSISTTRSSSTDLATGTDHDGRAAWMDNYCSQNPLHNIAAAAVGLVIHLNSR
jgi:hypothetical protein